MKRCEEECRSDTMEEGVSEKQSDIAVKSVPCPISLRKLRSAWSSYGCCCNYWGSRIRRLATTTTNGGSSSSNNNNNIELNMSSMAAPHAYRRGSGAELEESTTVVSSTKSARVASLDVFRGLTVALMVLVDDAGYWWPRITHAPWNGCTLADFVMPFFLFIVGVAIALSFKRVTSKGASTRRAIWRTLKLTVLGILLQGGFLHGSDELSYGVDMKLIRWTGILQRIALSYLIVSLVEIASANAEGSILREGFFEIFRLYRWHWVAALFIVVIYHLVVYCLYVPDWHFIPGNARTGAALTVKCGVRANFGPACNAVGFVDRTLLGKHHLYWHPAWRRSKWCSLFSPDTGPSPPNAPNWCFGPFEPEGIMSSISAILSCIIGVHYGHVLIHFKDHFNRLLHWIVPGICLMLLGTILHVSNAIILNKQLYSFSYVCFTAGAAALVFSAFYILVKMKGSGFLKMVGKGDGFHIKDLVERLMSRSDGHMVPYGYP